METTNKTIWLSEHIDTAHSRTLRSCMGWAEFVSCAERWLSANGGLVDYFCPGNGESNTYSLQDIQELSQQYNPLAPIHQTIGVPSLTAHSHIKPGASVSWPLAQVKGVSYLSNRVTVYIRYIHSITLDSPLVFIIQPAVFGEVKSVANVHQLLLISR